MWSKASLIEAGFVVELALRAIRLAASPAGIAIAATRVLIAPTYAVALLELFDIGPDLLNDTDTLVAEGISARSDYETD
jgi:hypothetical protein